MNQNRQDIDENLLLQYLLGNADDESGMKIAAWLNADSRNSKQLDQLEALWLETGRLVPPPVPVDLQKAWKNISTRIDKHEKMHASSKSTTIGRRYIYYAISAAATVILVLGIYIVMRLVTGRVKEVEIATNGLVIKKTLTDGTKILINRNSKLTCPENFPVGNRLVKLTGEAFFEVARNPSAPFVVDAGIAKVKVLGTVFNVSAYPGKDVLVTVSEGRVLFFTASANNNDTLSVILVAGMSGIYKPGSARPEILKNPLPDNLFWANRTLEFTRTPLSEVFKLIEQYYGVKVSVGNQDILDCQLSATFVNDPADRIMDIIAESFGLNVSLTNGIYYFKGNGCTKGNN